jgi:hypothetical protein
MVEFRVGTATMARYNEPPTKEQSPKESRLLILQPETALADGAVFEVIHTGSAVTHLDNLNLLAGNRPDKFFGGQTIRITGD